MIFYFTGTGNSLYAAQTLAQHKQSIVNITDVVKTKEYNYTLSKGESVGFVFPIYYWGLPTIIEEFLDKLQISNYNNAYTFAVCTCGENIGETMKVLKKRLSARGFQLDSGFSVAMPDNYIILYDIISKEAQHEKVQKADNVLEQISRIIENKEKGVYMINKGMLPGFFTYFVHKFYTLGRDTKKFYVTDTCIGCGKCERICPVNAINMVNNKPEWHGKCTQCLGCIHRCPVNAIQYGDKTIQRGRYINPNVKL
ncbi:MAG: 4Fe-4S ferredoxin iron-sulfur binding domain protein [Lachnospiraceae bacterium]|jgi:NAD-dependent dihydropyrimidine dehydrogenase PreA subunit/molybdopterin converting factor small subunit|nr:4Fe-4S ferredoxin iron-sulfur binding domain protein [Lachnospiraceae bacterium]